MSETTTTKGTPAMSTTYAREIGELLAARDAGEITSLEFTRASRALDLDQHRARYACRVSLDRAARHGDRVARAIRSRTGLGTPALLADLERGGVDARYAAELLKLDTVEERRAAWSGARRFLNATPDAGRPSDALASTVRAMLAGHAA